MTARRSSAVTACAGLRIVHERKSRFEPGYLEYPLHGGRAADEPHRETVSRSTVDQLEHVAEPRCIHEANLAQIENQVLSRLQIALDRLPHEVDGCEIDLTTRRHDERGAVAVCSYVEVARSGHESGAIVAFIDTKRCRPRSAWGARFDEAGGDRSRLLALDVHGGIHAPHRIGAQTAAECVDRAREALAVLARQVAPDDGREVLEGEQVPRVCKDAVAAGGQLALGREDRE